MHFIKYRHQQTALSIFNLPSDVGFNTGDKDRLSNQVDAEAWTPAWEREEGGKAAGRLRWGRIGGRQAVRRMQGQERDICQAGWGRALFSYCDTWAGTSSITIMCVHCSYCHQVESKIWNCNIGVKFGVIFYIKCFVGNLICWKSALKWSSAERHPSLSNVAWWQRR